MDHFPSPPASPAQQYYHDDDVDKVVCGSCDKTLSSDWFCANCHKRCATCNRFLSVDDHCSRCWAFDSERNIFVRKQPPPPPPPTTAVVPANNTTTSSPAMTTSPPSPPPQQNQQRCHIFFFVAPNPTSTGGEGKHEKL